MTQVILIVPDAGPLISLAKIDGLPILLRLGLPIYVVDQVSFEVTREKDRLPDARRIEEWIRAHPRDVNVFETAVGRAAAARRGAGEARQPGQGEAAIAEFLNRLEEVTGDANAPALLLYEDSDVRKSRFVLPENIHVISTWGLRKGLERKGLVTSAAEVWAAIEAAGRKPAREHVDLPGASGGRPTRW